MQGLFGNIGQGLGGQVGEPEEENLNEEDMMENVKVSYDFFIQNQLPHTSHSIQWLPKFEDDAEFANFEFAHFLSGTHIDEDRPNEQSVIQELRVRIPKLSKTEKTTVDYSGLDRTSHSKVQIVTSIPHEGEVLKCRQNPFDDQSIASILTGGDVNIYKKDGTLTGKLLGLPDESFCLDWNKKKAGQILSAAKKTVYVWDVEQNLGQGHLLKIDPAHGETDVNDAKFSPLAEHLVLTSGGDGMYKIWDIRASNSQCAVQGQACEEAVNCGTFNNVVPELFALGSEEKSVTVWDMRMPQSHLNEMTFHESQVTCVEWHPTKAQICISGSDDGKVYVWDNAKNGEEQARKDYDDGPPEMVFPHMMHNSQIEDISFCPAIEGRQQDFFPTVASVETQLFLQVWKPKEDFFEEEVDMIDCLHEIKNEDLE